MHLNDSTSLASGRGLRITFELFNSMDNFVDAQNLL